MHERRRYAEAHGDDKRKLGNARPRLLYNEFSKPHCNPRLIQGDGEDQAAHNKDDHRMHIRRPGLFDGRNLHDYKKNCNADGRDLKRDRFRHKEKDQYYKDCEKPVCPWRKTILIIDLSFCEVQFYNLFLYKIG